ncbi:MAG: hypothetical protein K0S93_2365 [Nitrososphaeraceae archaeon]|jgi:hypothetical protein|nr:hypothetical protein [Nitrososphaeraceae archaeon]MDW0150548.1 hypothetical protein [Nitrososphaeraceae archaeon]
MENKKITNSPSSTNGITAAERLKSSYEHFTAECSKLFPKVDQKLLLDMIHLQTSYKDWEGSVLLKIVYSSNSKVDTNKKKEEVYKRFQKMPDEVIEGRTLRVKLIRMYIQDLENLITSDRDIEFVTGSATLAPSDSYSDSA